MSSNDPSGGAAEDPTRRLEVFVGRWINEGETVPRAGERPVRILTSDVYDWMVGGRCVVHTAYGRIGDTDGGGLEVLSYDEAAGRYLSRFFAPDGSFETHTLVRKVV